MTRKMVMIGFPQAQNCTNLPSSWRHPESRDDSMSTDYYREIARILESGKFHMALFDDWLAMPDRYGNDHAHTVEYCIRCVKMDPIVVLTTMGTVTEKLGLASTCSTTYYEPFDVRLDGAYCAEPGPQTRPSLPDAFANRGALRFGLERLDDGLCRCDEFGAGSVRPRRLPADACSLEKQCQRVGEHFGFGNARPAAQLSQPAALFVLHFLDEAARGVAGFRQFDGGVGEIATSAIDGNAILRAFEPRLQLRLRIVRIISFDSVPNRVGFGRDTAKIGNDEFVL
jgi:hypothetical protein